MNEARESLNVRFLFRGFDCQYTRREDQERNDLLPEFLTRLDELEAHGAAPPGRQPPPPPPHRPPPPPSKRPPPPPPPPPRPPRRRGHQPGGRAARTGSSTRATDSGRRSPAVALLGGRGGLTKTARVADALERADLDR